ncbi:hypothetical protein BLNAU_23519 [Blattamonas nauphoetae]|uniref:Uncharacterized protein n=1 Tax=Blattamonas nauphoetae TaxID=2049346 RepID=A0ABQ9WPZ9_9EUKA|nr:hypothetical protein BLNAU_23519 [Blattamonas nauphoetae]
MFWISRRTSYRVCGEVIDDIPQSDADCIGVKSCVELKGACFVVEQQVEDQTMEAIDLLFKISVRVGKRAHYDSRGVYQTMKAIRPAASI